MNMVKKRVRDLLVDLKKEGYDVLKACVGTQDSETYWLPENTDSLQDYILHYRITGFEDAPLLFIDDILTSDMPKYSFNGIVHWRGRKNM